MRFGCSLSGLHTGRRAAAPGAPFRVRPRRAGRAGFTLLELVVALAILAIISSAAIPRFLRGLARQRMSAAARKVDADLRWARQRAVQSGAACTLSFSPAARSYRLKRGTPAALGADLFETTLADEPFCIASLTADFGGDALLSFDAYGLPDSGGTLVLSSGGVSVTITLDTDTGLPNDAVWN